MAVFEPLTAPQLEALCSAFKIEMHTFQPISAGSEHSNFFVTAQNGSAFVLTVLEPRTPAAHVAPIMAWVNNLHAQGYRCPLFATAAIAVLHNGKPVTLQSRLPGQECAAPNAEQAHQAGWWLGRLHTLQAALPVTDAMHSRALMQQLQRTQPQTAEQQHVHTILEEGFAALAPLPEDTPVGAYHLDYFADNVLWHNGAFSGVIDYWFAAAAPVAYDLAIALNAWGYCAAEGALLPEHFRAFSEGYTQQRKLHKTEQRYFAAFMQRAALRFAATRHMDGCSARLDASFNKPVAPWLARLHQHQQQKEWADYLG